MLVKKVDQVKRWVNLRIWPVSVEPYFFLHYTALQLPVTGW